MSASGTLAIVYIYGQVLPNKAANSAAVIGLCSALAAKGASITVISPDEDGCAPDKVGAAYAPHLNVSFRFFKIPAGFRRYPVLAFTTYRVAARAAIVVTRMPPAAILMALLGRRTVLELHQDPATYKHWHIWRRLLPLVPASRLRVVTNTSGIADSLDPLLRKRFGGPRVLPSAARDFAAYLGTAPRYDIGFIGSFMPGKGVGFVETLATISPDRSFVLYGDPTTDGETADRLKRLPNVTLAGYVSPSDVGQALASFRAGLAPYDRAGFGGNGSAFIRADDLSSLKIVEYMSAGRLVLASRIPSVERMVQHGETALLCDPEDVQDWKRRIDLLFSDPEAGDRVAANARRRYEQDYSFEIRAQRFLDVIAEFR